MNSKDLKENLMTIGVTTLVIVVCLIILPKLLLGKSIDIDNLNEEGTTISQKTNPYITVEGNKKVEVYRSNTGKTEKIDLEDYIIGVVSGEMPISFEEEALKAQAVAARTYYFTKREEKCDIAKNGDICDTIHCQVYMNKKERKAQWDKKVADSNYKKIEKAVKETEGKVLAYNGEIIKYPQFFSTSSGKTENSEDVFVSAVPYLKSIESKGEEISPKFTGEKEITNLQFASLANKTYGANINSSNVQSNVKVLGRTEGGSIEKIQIGQAIIKGTEFRKLYDLSSANCELEFFKDKVKIKTKGSGHGVGMSQWGANVMAKEGKKYDEILKHYYSGVEIKKIKYK